MEFKEKKMAANFVQRQILKNSKTEDLTCFWYKTERFLLKVFFWQRDWKYYRKIFSMFQKNHKSRYQKGKKNEDSTFLQKK